MVPFLYADSLTTSKLLSHRALSDIQKALQDHNTQPWCLSDIQIASQDHNYSAMVPV